MFPTNLPNRVFLSRTRSTYAYVIRDMAGNVLVSRDAEWQLSLALQSRGYSPDCSDGLGGWSR